MRRILFWVICLLFLGFTIWLISTIAYCARGGGESYKNYFDITQYEDDFSIWADVKKIDAPNTLTVESVLFECKIKNSNGKKDSFTFKINTTDENGNPAVIAAENRIIITLTEQDIVDYMKMKRIEGTVQSYKIKDIAFTCYHMESDNFPVWKFVFDPIKG